MVMTPAITGAEIDCPTEDQQQLPQECRVLGCDAEWVLFNRRCGATYRLHYQDEMNQRAKNKVSSNWKLTFHSYC
jgi:hypothetical protein